MAPRREIVTTGDQLERLVPAWDELAAEAGAPASLGGWLTAWWRQLAPAGAQLRVVAVHDEDRLVGLAPLYAVRAPGGLTRVRLLGTPQTHRVAPLAAPGFAPAVAALTAEALASASPPADHVAFEAVGADDPWLDALRGAWPGRRPPWRLEEKRDAAPAMRLDDDDFEAWLMRRSKNMRKQVRRFRRILGERGGVVRMTATEDELERDVASFIRLHEARWDERGGSSFDQRTGALLRDAGRALLPSGRFRLWMIDLDGRAISAQLFLAAGDEVLAWNGGFDPAAVDVQPSLLGILAGVEDAFAIGARAVDLGGGAHEYKLRLADEDRPLAWAGLVPRTRRYPLNRALLAPRQLEGIARERLAAMPEERRERARELIGRARRLGRSD